MKKFFMWSFFLIWLASVVFAGYAYFEAKEFLATAPVSAEEAQDVTVTIKPGSSFNAVANQLYEQGIITNVFAFKMLASYLEVDKNVQAGHFEFNTGWLPQQVIDVLVLGKPIYHTITIREGLPWWEVGKLLEKEGFVTYADFKKVIHDPQFLAHWGIPFDSAEGFLYPDTYFLPPPRSIDTRSAEAVAGRLIDTFWRKTKALWKEVEPERERPSKDVLKKYLSLASIIEKETGVPSERARVSGVYTNRIRAGMLLQADPTVIYGLGESFELPLLKKHLQDKSNKYNTYANAGLPPGPICSPSLKALEAAVYPEEHKYYYFVAKGTDGSHYFAKSLNEHNNNVRLYRQTLGR